MVLRKKKDNETFTQAMGLRLCDPVLGKDDETFIQVMVLFMFMVFGLISIIISMLENYTW
jgi:hypothetical protein